MSDIKLYGSSVDSVDKIFRSVVLPVSRRLNSLRELTFKFLSLMIKNQKFRISLQIFAQRGFGILLFQTEKINERTLAQKYVYFVLSKAKEGMIFVYGIIRL